MGTAEPCRSSEAGNVGIAVAACGDIVGPEAKEWAKEVVVPVPTPSPQRPLTQNDSVTSSEEARPGKATEKVDDACPANAGGDQLMPAAK